MVLGLLSGFAVALGAQLFEFGSVHARIQLCSRNLQSTFFEDVWAPV